MSKSSFVNRQSPRVPILSPVIFLLCAHRLIVVTLTPKNAAALRTFNILPTETIDNLVISATILSLYEFSVKATVMTIKIFMSLKNRGGC